MRKNVQIGGVYGRLTVIAEAGRHEFPNGRRERLVRCSCECGGEMVIHAANLASGNTKSCGCYRREHSSEKSTTHGASKSAEYRAWCHMNNRCYNPNVERFKHYGGRGIRVADEWRGQGGFERFMEHIGPRPGPKYSIDRIDTSGHYEPGNVRWATPIDQAATRRVNIMVEVDGERMPLRRACIKYGVNYLTVYSKVRRGVDCLTALTTTRAVPS